MAKVPLPSARVISQICNKLKVDIKGARSQINVLAEARVPCQCGSLPSNEPLAPLQTVVILQHGMQVTAEGNSQYE